MWTQNNQFFLSFAQDSTCQEISLPATNDTDYSARRQLRSICLQNHPWDDVLTQATQILPGLSIADVHTVTNESTLHTLGITHVISVVRTLD